MLAPAPRIKTVGFVSAISHARLLELKRVLGFIERRQPQRNMFEVWHAQRRLNCFLVCTRNTAAAVDTADALGRQSKKSSLMKRCIGQNNSDFLLVRPVGCFRPCHSKHLLSKLALFMRVKIIWLLVRIFDRKPAVVGNLAKRRLRLVEFQNQTGMIVRIMRPHKD